MGSGAFPDVAIGGLAIAVQHLADSDGLRRRCRRRRLACVGLERGPQSPRSDRKSTRLNSSHLGISYAVFCLKKKKTATIKTMGTMEHHTDLSFLPHLDVR